MADALLEFETLNGDEVEAILRGEDLTEVRRRATPPAPDARASAEPSSPEKPVPESGKAAEGFAY